MREEDIFSSLLDYLRSVTACPVLAYAETPTQMREGYDATIVRFALRGAPDPFSGPLVLRLFQATADAQQAPREAAVQNALAELGYLAPRVFIAETSIEPLGGPFLIMERMPGRALGSEFKDLTNKRSRAELGFSSAFAAHSSRGSATLGRGTDAFAHPIGQWLRRSC